MCSAIDGRQSEVDFEVDEVQEEALVQGKILNHGNPAVPPPMPQPPKKKGLKKRVLLVTIIVPQESPKT